MQRRVSGAHLAEVGLTGANCETPPLAPSSSGGDDASTGKFHDQRRTVHAGLNSDVRIKAANGVYSTHQSSQRLRRQKKKNAEEG